MASWLVLLVCVGATVARPQEYANDEETQVHELSASETADIIRDLLPNVNKALTSQGSPMSKIENVVLSLLPIGDAAIEEKSAKYDDYDKEKYEKQQEDAEKIVPSLLETVKTLVALIPTNKYNNFKYNFQVDNYQPDLDISDFSAFDSPFVSNEVIKGQYITATDFVPEIVIPDIVIQ